MARNNFLITLEIMDIDDTRSHEIVRLNTWWMWRRRLRTCLRCSKTLPIAGDNVFGGLIEAFRPTYVKAEETRLLTLGKLLLQAYKTEHKRQKNTENALQKLNYLERVTELQTMHATFQNVMKKQYQSYEML